MSHSIHFLLGSGNNYSAAFPTAIDHTNEVDPISRLAFAQAFQSAQNAYIPYYSVAVVQSGNKGEEFYHIYDTQYFTRYRIKQESQRDPTHVLQDPITGRGIQKINYFATKCFQPDEESLCRPTDLHNDPVYLFPLEISNLRTDVQTMLLDGMNGNIFETGQEKDQKQVRRTQDIIAKLIKSKAIFTHLSENERKNETIQWFWCSSQGSFQGLVDLAAEHVEQHPSDPHAKKVALNLLSKICPLSQISPPLNRRELSRGENQALIEGQNLFAKLSKETAPVDRGSYPFKDSSGKETL